MHFDCRGPILNAISAVAERMMRKLKIFPDILDSSEMYEHYDRDVRYFLHLARDNIPPYTRPNS